MEYLFRRLNVEAEELSDKPDGFWLAQRQQIHNRVPQSRSFFVPRFALAGLAATVILAMTLLLRTPAPKPAANTLAENDQQLMVEVEQTLDSNIAPALEPTGALVDAMTQNSSNHTQSVTKENRK